MIVGSAFSYEQRFHVRNFYISFRVRSGTIQEEEEIDTMLTVFTTILN